MIRDLGELKQKLERAETINRDEYVRWAKDHGLGMGQSAEEKKTKINETRWYAPPEWLTGQVIDVVVFHSQSLKYDTVRETDGWGLEVRGDVGVVISAEQYFLLRGLASDRNGGDKERMIIGWGPTVPVSGGRISLVCLERCEFGDTSSASSVNVEHGGGVFEGIVAMLGHTHPFGCSSPLAGRFSPKDFENFTEPILYDSDGNPMACICAVFTDSFDEIENGREPQIGWYYFDPKKRGRERMTRLGGLYVVANDLNGVVFHSLSGNREVVWEGAVTSTSERIMGDMPDKSDSGGEGREERESLFTPHPRKGRISDTIKGGLASQRRARPL